MTTQPEPQGPEAPWPIAPPGAPGLRGGFPLAREVPARAALTGRYPMVALLLAGLTLLTLVLVLVAKVAPPSLPAPCNPGNCEQPPHGRVLGGGQALPGPDLYSSEVSYASPSGFSLRYWPTFTVPGDTGQYQVVPTDYSEGLKLTFDAPSPVDGSSYLEVLGAPYSGSAAGLVASEIGQVAPGAQLAYTVPGAWVGYEPGFGEAFDYEPPFSFSSTAKQRVILLATVQDGFAILVIAQGSLLAPVGPDDLWWDGHPSPSDVNIAYLADESGEIVNSIQFP